MHRRRYGRYPAHGLGHVGFESPSGGSFNVYLPTGYSAGTEYPLLILCHSAGNTQTNPFGTGAAATAITDAQAAGYLCASALADQTRAWGNPQSIDEYVDLFNYMAGTYKISRTVIWAASMGGLAAFTLAGSGRIPGLKGVLAMYPVCSLANFYADQAGYQAEINSAWSSTTYTDHIDAAKYDPYLRASSAFAGLRFRFTHSASDTIVSKTRHTDLMHTLVSASAVASTVQTTSGDHGDASNWTWADHSAFLASCV